MKQLPGSDAIFLSMETPSVHAHTGALTILDPSTCDDFSFEKLKALTSERIRLAPKFTWKLREVPFGLDRPFWVEDPDFDPANHMHRIGVPRPGGMRELADLCSDLFAHKLDRRRPVWEIWYIEGLEGGRVAIFSKTHHCMIDGVSGSDLGQIMCDTQPDPPPRRQGPRKRKPKRERVPGDLELAARSLPTAMGTPFRLARYATQAINRGITMAKYLRDEEAPPMGADIPQVSWNDQIGPRRRFACARVSLESVRELSKLLGVKVNDVVLELCGSAMRRYLKAQDGCPRESLVAGVPVSTRTEEDGEVGNKVANMIVSLATDIDDPVERLLQIYKNTQKSKEMTQAIRAKKIQAMGDTVVPGILNLAFRTLTMAPPMGVPTATISNVPGPPIPLYTAGARMESMYPMSVLVPGNGLNITVVSYMGNMDFGFTCDPDLIPDPWYLAEGVEKALAELQKAIDEKAGSPGERRDESENAAASTRPRRKKGVKREVVTEKSGGPEVKVPAATA